MEDEACKKELVRRKLSKKTATVGPANLWPGGPDSWKNLSKAKQVMTYRTLRDKGLVNMTGHRSKGHPAFVWTTNSHLLPKINACFADLAARWK